MNRLRGPRTGHPAAAGRLHFRRLMSTASAVGRSESQGAPGGQAFALEAPDLGAASEPHALWRLVRLGLELSVQRCQHLAERRARLQQILEGRRAVVVLARAPAGRRLPAVLQGQPFWSFELDPLPRQAALDRFQLGAASWLVVAGAQLPELERSVELIVHWGWPPSLRRYAQQVFRLAGEAGKQACLLWGPADVRARRMEIERRFPPPALLEGLQGCALPEAAARGIPSLRAARRWGVERAGSAAELDRIVRRVARGRAAMRADLAELLSYSLTPACRGLALLRAARQGEPCARCGRCDNCSRRRALTAPEQQLARSILMAVTAGRGRLRRWQLVRQLLHPAPPPRGAPAQGLLAGRAAQFAAAWLESLAAEAWVRIEPGNNGRIELTEAGCRLLLDPAAALVANPPLESMVAKRRPAPAELPEVEAALRPLLGRLRRLRWRLALRLGVEPYRLFSNRTLLELVQRRPRSAVDLIQVPGFGPWRLERIGRQVLDAVADESALVDRTERTSGNQADADPPPG